MNRQDISQFPDMIELDENGCQWAAAASVSEDTDPDDSGTESIDEPGGPAPSSVIHMGEAPPQPHPLQQIYRDTITLSAKLIQSELSPIMSETEDPFNAGELHDLDGTI